MNEQKLKKLLNRFRRCDYATVVSEWRALADERLREHLLEEVAPSSNRISKKEFYDMLRSCLHKDSSLWKESLGELDLLYVELYSHLKTWIVFRMEKISVKPTVEDVATFQQKLNKELTCYSDFSVSVRVSSQAAFWIRVLIKDGRTFSPSYFIFHPRSTFLLSYGLKSKTSESILEAMLYTFNCKQIDELQLTGKCVNSLLKLCLQKYDKANASKILLKDPETRTPNISHAKRKRKAPESPVDDLTSVVNEHANQIQRNLDFVDAQFGNAKLPKLETLKYDLKTPFFPIQSVPAMAVHRDQAFHCRVNFQGSDVLEGIKNLCRTGVVQLPLKKHLANVQSMARNHFVLRPKLIQTVAVPE